tara:strand:+ start:1379 stop:2695 length:1317 start_codon:yes stop_codon:yes gene_type:complete
MKKVGIIGGGICGLSAALALKENRINFKLFESSENIGGAFKTIHDFDCILEHGPNSINSSNDDLKKIINFLNLEDECLYANILSKNRFIVKNKKIIPIPLSFKDFIKTKLFSTRAKLRLFKEPFIKSKSLNNESLNDFILRRFGKEILDYAVNPFVKGIYAGDPKRLSAKSSFPKLIRIEKEYGSILNGMIKMKKNEKKSSARIFTFKNGMHTLPKEIEKHIKSSIKYNSPVNQISKTSSGNWLIYGEEFTDVIFTQPSYRFNNFRAPFDVSVFKQIYCPPITTVNLLYKKNQITHDLDGFGLLIPECEKMFILGVLFPSVIFKNRSPENLILLTVYVGGSNHPDRALLSKEELIRKIELDLKVLIGLDGTSLKDSHYIWNQAIPQYDLNIDKVHKRIEELENLNKGIYFSGNYRSGISIPNAISSGYNTANKIVKSK